MTLNPDQKNIFDHFAALHPVTEPKVYILNAPAGTGKTYLVTRIYYSHPRDIVNILVPTHKAASVFPHGIASTIHSFFESGVVYSEEGERLYKLRRAAPMRTLRLLIVDEASMVSSEMLAGFLTLNIIILFICDEAQLPPIDEETSPIFQTPHHRFDLTQNMRSAHSPYAAAVTRFRTNVFLKHRVKSTLFLKKVSTEDVVGAFRARENCVILAWTNKRKNAWNSYVRSFLFGGGDIAARDTLDKVYQDEQLVFTGMRQEGSRTYHTSDIITVKHLKQKEYVLDHHLDRCDCKDSAVKKNKCVECSKWKAIVNMWEIMDEHSTRWLMPVGTEDKTKIEARAAAHKKYILTLSKDKRGVEWRDFYMFTETYLPELAYCYTSTVHKAQGSEWSCVFVDYNNISWSEQMQGSLFQDRIMYTAVSRMKDEVYQVELPREAM